MDNAPSRQAISPMNTGSSSCNCQNNLNSSSNKEPRRLCQSVDDCCGVCAKLEVLNSRISELKAALEESLHERDGLRSRLNNTHPSIVDRMPLEVASIVFDFFATDRDSPLVLGAVCQRWRRIAWSIPQLWMTFELRIEGEEVSENRVQLAKDWLARSGGLPLFISLHVQHIRRDSDPNRNFNQLFPLIDLVNEYSDRWHKLSVWLPRCLLARLNHKSSVSSLKILRLCSFDEESLDIDTLAGVAPSKLSVHGFWFSAGSFTWTNVRHFNSSLIWVDQLIETLRLAPKLFSCIFDSLCLRGDVPPAVPFRPLAHPHLRSLELEVGKMGMAPILSTVDLPNLRKLHLRGYFDEVATDELSYFFRRSANKLEDLSITGYSLSGDDLVQITKYTPLLRSLNLGDIDHNDNLSSFYHAMASTSNNELPANTVPFLPHLQSFRWQTFASVPWDLIALLLPRRDQNGRCLGRPLNCIQVSCNRTDENENPVPYVPTVILEQFSQYLEDIEFDFEVDFDEGTKDLWALSLNTVNK